MFHTSTIESRHILTDLFEVVDGEVFHPWGLARSLRAEPLDSADSHLGVALVVGAAHAHKLYALLVLEEVAERHALRHAVR